MTQTISSYFTEHRANVQRCERLGRSSWDYFFLLETLQCNIPCWQDRTLAMHLGTKELCHCESLPTPLYDAVLCDDARQQICRCDVK